MPELLSDGEIRFQEENPKKKDTAAYARYEKYKAARTVSDFYKLAEEFGSRVASRDFSFDLAKGYVKYKRAKKAKPTQNGKDATEKPSPEDASLAARGPEKPAVSGPREARELSDCSGAPSRGSAASTASPVADQAEQPDNLEPDSRSSLDPPLAKRAKTEPALSAEKKRNEWPKEDDSLFSLVELGAGKPGKEMPPAPERRQRKQAKAVEAIAPPRGAKRKSSETKTSSNTPELVREAVPDYIEGQPDPAVCDEKKRSASFVADKEPISAQNRMKFVWTVQQEVGVFSHDPKMAGPVAAEQQSSVRCAVCGHPCQTVRHTLFRVRCYARRTKGDRPEFKRPRKMRAEEYYVGARCMEVLLGTPSILTKKVRQLRERLQQALEARDFQLEAWAFVLRRLEVDQLQPFAQLLAGELRRVIRRRASDEQTDRIQARANLKDLQTFEDRERHRQWRLDQLVLRRCRALDELLQVASSKQRAELVDKSDEEVNVPNVMDDLLSIATKGVCTMDSLKLRGRPAGAAEEVSILEEKAKVSREAPVEEPSPTSPQEMGPPGFEPWDGADSVDLLSLEMAGFRRALLNRNFIADKVTRVNDARTFWDESRDVFMYWQRPSKRWSICQRWDKDEDLLQKVRQGAELGWAFFASPGVWQEFWHGKWTRAFVTTRKELRDLADPVMQAQTPMAAISHGGFSSTLTRAAALSFAPAARDIQSPLAAPSVQPGVPTHTFPSSAPKAFALNMVQSDTPPLPSMSFFEASGLRSARAAEHRFQP